jgi:hypothetical protein
LIDISAPELSALAGTEVLIRDLEMSSLDLDSQRSTREPWSLEDSAELWQVDLLAEWIPSILQVDLFEADESFDLRLDELWRCELDSLEFRGQIEVVTGGRHRRYDGLIHLSVLPDLAPEQGCLLQLSAGQEELGVWSPPTPDPGRVWVRFEGRDALPLDEIQDLVDGESLFLDSEMEPRLEIWFSDEGEPWAWESDVMEVGWQNDHLWLLEAEVGGDDLALNLGELTWPDPENQGERIWIFDLLGTMPDADSKGLVSLVELSSCELESSNQ